MTKIISIGNQKGGSGKTTTTIHLASSFTRLGYKVLVIDADVQRTAYRWAMAKAFKFDTIPLEINLQTGKYSQNILSLIKLHYKNYNFILIDCPPAAESEITYSSLLMSDLVIIPVVCTPPDLWATITIRSTVDRAKIINKNLKSFILINRYQPKLIVVGKILEKIEELKIPLFNVKVGQRTAFVESAAQGTTVFELKDKLAIEEIESLTNEIFKVLK